MVVQLGIVHQRDARGDGCFVNAAVGVLCEVENGCEQEWPHLADGDCLRVGGERESALSTRVFKVVRSRLSY
ncbi:hypothetical protein PV350_31440 [Streptomyces sp. PA03-6a]|nr:hypothetical protein [Streptomyces sp. PA03-6a]